MLMPFEYYYRTGDSEVFNVCLDIKL